MKRPIFLAITVVALAFCYCFYYARQTDKPALAKVPEADASTSLVKSNVESPLAVTTQQPSKVASTPSQPLTDDRRRIFDSADAMKMISSIRASGTSDEKQWASSLLTTCVQNLTNLDAARPAAASDSPELARLKEAASKTLAQRCKGVGDLNNDERNALRNDLRNGARVNPGIYVKLDQLSGQGDGRWSGEQAQLVTNALYGRDPVVARAAFRAMLASIDSDAPGGRDRQTAFLYALSPTFLNQPLSEYEQLLACKNAGRCPGVEVPAEDGSILSPNTAALADKYRAAVQGHEDAQTILAIR